jgi:hypothetical protein
VRAISDQLQDHRTLALKEEFDWQDSGVHLFETFIPTQGRSTCNEQAIEKMSLLGSFQTLRATLCEFGIAEVTFTEPSLN